MPVAAEHTTMIIAVAASAVIIWLFCAYSTASLARANGAGFNSWLLFGFLGGPIALVFAYLYFRYAGERHRRVRYGEGGKYDLPEMVKCPRCNQSVPTSFEYCQFCGQPIHRKRRR